MNDNEYRGKCPVCSSQLEQVAGTLQCSDHFSIDQAVFERLWDAYEASPQSVKDGDTLLELLVANNVAVNKPVMRTKWKVK